MPITQIILAIVVVVIFWLIFTFNRLVVLRNRAKEAWSDIETQLKRRYDLIPNLIETVKGYATHERELFERVTQARTAAMATSSIQERGKAEDMLSGTLKSLFAVVENYPQLRAVENFLALQQEISDTENKIQSARRFYNGNVRDLNIQIEIFPVNTVAGIFGFKKMEFFEINEPNEREPAKAKSQ